MKFQRFRSDFPMHIFLPDRGKTFPNAKMTGIRGRKRRFYTYGARFLLLFRAFIHFSARAKGQAHSQRLDPKQARRQPHSQRLEPKQARRTAARVKARSTPSSRVAQLARAAQLVLSLDALIFTWYYLPKEKGLIYCRL